MTETYTELYKRYRPRVWGDIIGQDKVIEPLKKVAVTRKIPTGYMFAGPHGCGKTSSAFILAKSLNCENLQENGDPCNECQVCKAIDTNTQVGVQYISMANRGSAEDVRKIVQEAQLMQPINHQVWILDECHRLSPAAFDALLIPLESEKTKSLFIFCSTEPEKIPATILSRLQARSFSTVDMPTLARNLKSIVIKEGLDVSDDDIILAARKAGGSVRDSIRNLETIATDGVLPDQFGDRVLKLMLTQKFTEAFLLTSELQANSQNFAQVAASLHKDLADVLIIKAGGKPAVTSPALIEVAKELPVPLILRYLAILGDTITTMARNTVDSRVLFDIALTHIINERRNFERSKSK